MSDPNIQDQMNTKQRPLFRAWKETDKMWLYICIFLLMGIIHKPNIHAYWSREYIICTPILGWLMWREKQLRKMIHFTDSLNQNPDDELKKLRFFEETYKPEEHLAIDKYLSLSKPSTTIRRLHKSF